MILSYDVSLIPGILLYHMMSLLTKYITLSYDVSLIPGILLYHMMFLLYQVFTQISNLI